MPARQPFTALCRSLAAQKTGPRADLHVHTTCSDGRYTPAQIVELARRCGMRSVAVTDHDTLEAIPLAQAAAGASVEVIPAVEISTVHDDREIHLLAYFVDPEAEGLNAALAELRARRRERFFAMADRLRDAGVRLGDDELRAAATGSSLGRRNLAELMVAERRVGTVNEAFRRYLGDAAPACVPKHRLATVDAIRLVREAGGMSSWAHPSADATGDRLRELYNCGMDAVEVEWPTAKPSRVRYLRATAQALGLAVTAGSDCHGPDEPRRALGACGVTADELAELRRRALAPHRTGSRT